MSSQNQSPVESLVEELDVKVNAHITFYGPLGGQHSIRGPLEVLHLADGTYRAEVPLDDIPTRATKAVLEISPELRVRAKPPMIHMDFTDDLGHGY